MSVYVILTEEDMGEEETLTEAKDSHLGTGKTCEMVHNLLGNTKIQVNIFVKCRN